jgi:hypothetical protein
MLTRDAKSKVLVGALLELQSHSITAGQRRFLLESVFVPYLYVDKDDFFAYHWPQKIVIELIKTLMDVNEPIRRVECSLDYSIWQIFMFWLHEDGISICIHSDINVIEIFEAFLSQGADPCAIVSGKDLANSYLDHDCTLGGNAAPISATQLLEHLREHLEEHLEEFATNGEASIATIDCALALLADATQGPSHHR